MDQRNHRERSYGPAKQLILCGTVHLDPHGPITLWQLLKNLNPDAITVELSSWSLLWRQRLNGALRKRVYRNLTACAPETMRPPVRLRTLRTNARLRSLLLQLSRPYEWRVAARFAAERAIDIEPVDDDVLVKPFFKDIVTATGRRNIAYLLSNPGPPLRDQVLHQICRTMYPLRESISEDPSQTARDLAMTGRIRRRFESMSAGLLLHIGGWRHIVSSGSYLAQSLSDLNPLLIGPLKRSRWDFVKK